VSANFSLRSCPQCTGGASKSFDVFLTDDVLAEQPETFTIALSSPSNLTLGSPAGYDFWLGKLNQFNGNFVDAEMVKSFIVSSEYSGRFGQP